MDTNAKEISYTNFAEVMDSVKSTAKYLYTHIAPPNWHIKASLLGTEGTQLVSQQGQCADCGNDNFKMISIM